MIWGGISIDGLTELAFLGGRKSSVDYVKLLEDHLQKIKKYILENCIMEEIPFFIKVLPRSTLPSWRKAWKELDGKFVKTLVKSMDNRCFKVIENKENIISYW